MAKFSIIMFVLDRIWGFDATTKMTRAFPMSPVIPIRPKKIGTTRLTTSSMPAVLLYEPQESVRFNTLSGSAMIFDFLSTETRFHFPSFFKWLKTKSKYFVHTRVTMQKHRITCTQFALGSNLSFGSAAQATGPFHSSTVCDAVSTKPIRGLLETDWNPCLSGKHYFVRSTCTHIRTLAHGRPTRAHVGYGCELWMRVRVPVFPYWTHFFLLRHCIINTHTIPLSSIVRFAALPRDMNDWLFFVVGASIYK